MSDEGVLNVEDDGPALPAPAVAAEAPAAPVQPLAEPEPDEVEVAGQKMVPLGALLSERQQRQALAEKAARTDALEAYVQDARPYVEFLKANPQLLQPRSVPPAPAAFGTPADPQAEVLAKTLDLYTPEGQPDVARANVIRTMMTQTAEHIARQTMQPMQEDNFQLASARNFQMALRIKDADGQSPSPQALTMLWRTLPASQTADPQTAQVLALTAIGADRMSKKTVPVPPGTPPIVTEASGSGPRRVALSELETHLARDKGISAEAWAEHTKGYVKGRPQQLED